MNETCPVVVIGAGQAGLSVGYHLARRGIDFVILDANDRVGDSWRNRWDSLRLFTPAQFNGLDGMPFPAPAGTFPTKDEMADYLEAYAAHFALPVVNGVRVERLEWVDNQFVVSAGNRRFRADHVVVAMSGYQRGRKPDFADDLDPGILQIHSIDYRNPGQLRQGPVLIAGAGNSGAELAKELAGAHEIYMAGPDTGHLPFRIGSPLGRHLFIRLVLRVAFHRVLTTGTPVGRKLRPRVLHGGGPLIRVLPGDLAALGVRRTGRVAGVHDGKPLLEDGRVLDVANVLWCTGFDPAFSWIDLPVFDERGDPVHDRGVVSACPGLYFVGLHFLHSLSSAMIHGVGRDAGHIAGHIASRTGKADRRAGSGMPQPGRRDAVAAG